MIDDKQEPATLRAFFLGTALIPTQIGTRTAPLGHEVGRRFMKCAPKFVILFSLVIFVGCSIAPANAYYRGLPNRNAGQDWATRPNPVTNAGTKQKQVKPVKTTKQQQK